MSLFVDLVGLSEPRTNEALEYLYKAVGDGHDDVDLWAPHPDPYIRRIVELFSQRGVWLFDALRTELLAPAAAMIPATMTTRMVLGCRLTGLPLGRVG